MKEILQDLPNGAVLLYTAITAVSAFVGWFLGSIRKK